MVGEIGRHDVETRPPHRCAAIEARGYSLDEYIRLQTRHVLNSLIPKG
jgi:hypothetical protein